MKEKIYTIPINETFDAVADHSSCECPLCMLYRRLENIEVETILGGAMMVPEIRRQTNEQGFCRTHYDMMMENGGRLALGLILESHLEELQGDLKESFHIGTPGQKQEKRIRDLEQSCYICKRVNEPFERMLENTVLLWNDEREFREKFAKTPCFCIKHYRALIEVARRELNKKTFPDFYRAVSEIENRYLASLKDDVSWFCKKFDYRYDKEPWGNAKDALERSIRFLGADLHHADNKKTN